MTRVGAFVAGAIAGGASVAVYVLWTRRRIKTSHSSFMKGEYGYGTHPTKGGGAISIRLARRADVGKVLRLIQGLALYENQPLSAVEVTESDLALHFSLYQCILAETSASEPVAFALFYPSYSTWQGPCIYLEDLFVQKEHRGRGLGALLLKTVAAEAYARGCKRLHWNALDWNTPALKFYEKIGAKQLSEWLTLRMGRPEIAKLLSLS